MEKFGRARPHKRVEDQRFITGSGKYIADAAPKNALHAVFVRSMVAHGKLDPVNLDDARAMPGVRLALSATDLHDLDVTGRMNASILAKNVEGGRGADPRRPFLAEDRVRFVGEPIAVIVGETLEQAKDAAEAVIPEITDLAPKVDVDAGGETIHSEAENNVAFDWRLGDATQVEKVFSSAVHVVRTRIEDNRIISNSMETRGAIAQWDGKRLHFSFGGQAVWDTKKQLAKHLNLERDQVRVTIPDVGGGFGTKGMDYPEYIVISVAARELCGTVIWISDRTEAMLTDNAGRDLVSETELAFDEGHRIIGYRVDTLCNLGAYNSQYAQPIQTELFAKVASGVYDVRDVFLRCRGIFTNTVQVDAYRGAGRPEAIFALERSMDNAARVLGVDPIELRQKSFIPTAKFPYKTALADTYDVGDFGRVLSRVRKEADFDGFDARRTASKKDGKLRGIGLCYYIESILGDKKETSAVEFNDDGTVTQFVGTVSNGQGHETVFSTFLSDHTGIPIERIRLVQADSDRIKKGGGTGGSRSATVQSTALLRTVSVAKEAFCEFLSKQNDSADVEFDDERFRISGSNETPSMLEVADIARAEGRTDLLRFEEEIELDARSFPNGAHVAEVVIDPETGVCVLDRYTVTDDFGNLLNPMLVEGQIHGGVAQGVGQALTEHVVYDEDGQLLSASFMDYAMPRAADLPMIKFSTEPTPSTTNPLGMKGCGEAGTVGALAAVANAVADAVSPLGVPDVQIPFTPERVWRILESSKTAAQ
ncbi:MAG: xanthine dehydrogenase family protein molybdopterin-binding subunit [Boseongicola sp.]